MTPVERPSPVHLMSPKSVLQLGIMRHRGVVTCQRDHREPREDPGTELVSPKAENLGLFTQHTSRLGARAAPTASISEGWGLWVRQYLVCVTSFPEETLVHQQHTLGSKMHTTENHQGTIQPLRRAAGITMARITQTTHKELKIHAGILVLESSPLVHKNSRTCARGHWFWGLSNQLLPSWADLPLSSAGAITITPSHRAVGAPPDQGPIRNSLEIPLEI